MASFTFLPGVGGDPIILAPRRAHRFHKSNAAASCVFCHPKPEEILREVHLSELGLTPTQNEWDILIVKNDFPFAPHHEIIIDSPDHKRGFDQLPEEWANGLFLTFQEEIKKYSEDGQVIVFRNFGQRSGASIVHPHNQLVVVPADVKITMAHIPDDSDAFRFPLSDSCQLMCPQGSQWPDETWIVSGESASWQHLSREGVIGIAQAVRRSVSLLSLRHGKGFSYNFYLGTHERAFVRIIPRAKTLGGFELATDISVNTQDPKETLKFFKEHFHLEKIKRGYKAHYTRTA